MDLQIRSKNRCLWGSRSIDSVPKEGKARKGKGNRRVQKRREEDRGSEMGQEKSKNREGFDKKAEAC